jgi:cell division transport system permease protein
MLGLIGLLLLNAHKLSDYVKENIGFAIVINNDAREVEILKLQKELEATPYVRTTEYITRERAARDFTKTLGEDFVSFLGYNPLLASIDVKLFAGFANPDSIAKIEAQLKNQPLIKEIVYEKSLIHLVNENVKRISLIILGFSGLLFLIAIALVNNTIRLQVYSRRFIIRTMQLVGATKGFIRKPFLYRSLFIGFMAAVLASLLMLGLVYVIQYELTNLMIFIDFKLLSVLFVAITVLGMMLNFVSTFFALNKYLNIDVDNLY